MCIDAPPIKLLSLTSCQTHTGRIVAAVLIGVGPPGVSPTAAAASLGEGEEGEGSVPCWRGRLEVRCDDEGVLRCVC